MGHQIAPFEGTAPVIARVEAILRRMAGWKAHADGRGNAKAEGY